MVDKVSIVEEGTEDVPEDVPEEEEKKETQQEKEILTSRGEEFTEGKSAVQ